MEHQFQQTFVSALHTQHLNVAAGLGIEIITGKIKEDFSLR